MPNLLQHIKVSRKFLKIVAIMLTVVDYSRFYLLVYINIKPLSRLTNFYIKRRFSSLSKKLNVPCLKQIRNASNETVC